MKTLRKIIYIALISLLSSCRGDEVIVPVEYETIPVTTSPSTSIRGMYMVNEGNMGSNKCTLDFLDFLTGTYARNIYPERNPSVIKELGDVGNDIAVYGEKLYIVVNCSHKVEVLNARTGVRIGQINIPNCRYISFHEGNAYISSYIGPVQVDANSPLGAVFRIDTLSLDITGTVTVGYQPEEMEIIDGKLYVANSGGYRPPVYDNTISVVDLNSFRQIAQIPVDINLHRLKKDKYNRLWVNSRGNNIDRPSRLYMLRQNSQSGQMEVAATFDTPCSNMAIYDNHLYFFATNSQLPNTPATKATASSGIIYGIIDIDNLQLTSDNFITDGTEKNIAMPYALAVHPDTGEIFLSDAKNYVSSGTLYCFNPSGKKLWQVRTGDIPSAVAFLPR